MTANPRMSRWAPIRSVAVRIRIRMRRRKPKNKQSGQRDNVEPSLWIWLARRILLLLQRQVAIIIIIIRRQRGSMEALNAPPQRTPIAHLRTVSIPRHLAYRPILHPLGRTPNPRLPLMPATIVLQLMSKSPLSPDC
ncbi:hypothetical protein EMPG_15939 [Blastomyces silverae]|uniref:Uncharacterized protein n=1 Tax=Blastomyces silverae TaxID=2060906 RepID=A0A0H1BAY9_9EURO|nr:hypothetical protein EMPG_15939 [Blastomyces silverae]